MRKPFNDLISSYTVADADEALLDRIIAAADGEPRLPPVWMLSPALRFGVPLMAVALMVAGFWAGSSTAQVSAADTASTTAVAAKVTTASSDQADYLDDMIVAPSTAEKMAL